MRRKVIYLLLGFGLIAMISGSRFYQKSIAESGGYLGDKVIFFTADGSQALAKEEQEVTKDGSHGGKKGKKSGAGKSQASSLIASSRTAEKKYDKITSNGEIRTYDTGTVVLDDAAYELYTYIDSVADSYARTISKITKELGSDVKVYNLVVPTSVGITFPDNQRKKINSSDQGEAVNSIENKLSGKESFVPLYDILMQHRKEYIYFRTDHHWTSLGAYYAYQSFCEARGIVPNELSAYEKKMSEGFLGSFYRKTRHDKALQADTLEALYPISDNLSLEYTTDDGLKISAPVIDDAEKYSSSLKYCIYIGSDNPFTVIRNQDKMDGSSCVVVKESYGNAFIPFLADHYQTIYVIDYRYWKGKLIDFIEKKRSEDVIIINNISMTRSSYLVGKLSQIIA